MFQSILNRYFNYIESWLTKTILENPFTQLYGLARSILAFSTLTVFLFNDPSYIFDELILDIFDRSPSMANQINLFLMFDWEDLIYAKIISCLILILVISGYYPWLTCILHWWIAFSLQTGGIILDGGDQINLILTSLIIPIALLDRRKNHWHAPLKKVSYYSKVVAYCFFLLISLQMSFLYFNSAVEKIYGTEQWSNGTALYYIFNGSLFGLKGIHYSLFQPILESFWVIVLTWGVIVLELILSYFLFSTRNKRWLAFIIGVFFHLQIAYFFGLISFGLSMSAGLCLFALPFNIFEVLLKKWRLFKQKLSGALAQ